MEDERGSCRSGGGDLAGVQEGGWCSAASGSTGWGGVVSLWGAQRAAAVRAGGEQRQMRLGLRRPLPSAYILAWAANGPVVVSGAGRAEASACYVSRAGTCPFPTMPGRARTGPNYRVLGRTSGPRAACTSLIM